MTQIETKQAELAETGETLESSKEELPDTREQVSADQKFLMDLQTRCGTMDKEFADRSKIRSEETKAVNEALKILTDDDAHDLFAKSTLVQEESPASLLQVDAAGSKRAQALKVLRDAGIP